MKTRYLAFTASFALLALTVSPIPAATEAQRIERLEMLADIWGKLYLFHPRIVSANVDWNRTLVETIPKLEKAESADELVSVLNESLFKSLDDPFTIAQKQNASVSPPPRRELVARKLSGTVGYIDATDPRQYGSDPAGRIEKLVRDLGPLDALIVDLRFPAPLYARFDWVRLFLDLPQTTGGSVSRVHEGWNEDNSPSVYRQKWNVSPGSPLRPLADRSALRVPTAFIVNNASYSQAGDVLDVLQSAGRAVVILEQRGGVALRVRAERYAEDVEAWLNTSMLLSKSGNLGLQADFASPDPFDETKLASLAGKLLEERKSRKLTPSHPFSLEMTFPAPEPASQEFLSRERRLLGLFKLWTVISYMDLHTQYASLDWSKALREWIPKVEAAETVQEYYMVLQRMAAKLNDSHVGVYHSSLRSTGGVLPIQLRPIEGKAVVTGAIKETSGDEPAVRVGDEILAIGGKRVEEWFGEREPLISASTPGALRRNLVAGLTNGQGKDVLELVLQNDDGVRTVTLKTIPQPKPSPPPSFKVIEGGYGYINLDTLTEGEMQPALTAIAGTKGLVLDMRGYPRFFIQRMLVPRITDKPVQSAIWEYPVASLPDKLAKATRESFIWIDPHPADRYTRPIVVLIDDRAQSAAEGFCMFLRNARRATFVGSTTAGTNGNITRINLPGGGTMTFTGMRVKFADGSRFQNIGIVPDVKVEPTLRGIRAGRDEVLERGLEVLQSLL